MEGSLRQVYQKDMDIVKLQANWSGIIIKGVAPKLLFK